MTLQGDPRQTLWGGPLEVELAVVREPDTLVSAAIGDRGWLAPLTRSSLSGV